MCVEFNLIGSREFAVMLEKKGVISPTYRVYFKIANSSQLFSTGTRNSLRNLKKKKASTP